MVVARPVTVTGVTFDGCVLIPVRFQAGVASELHVTDEMSDCQSHVLLIYNYQKDNSFI